MTQIISQDDTQSSENATCTNENAAPFEPVATFIVIGKTGVGKSSFIKLLGGKNMKNGQDPVVDDGLESCTSTLAAFKTTVNGREVILLDTPGFDCSGCLGNLKTLNDIASSLYHIATGRAQAQVCGAIFLHDISETRFGESQKKTLSIFKSMCGERFMGNVIVGTTMWSPRDPEKYLQQQNREIAFTEKHWGGIYKTTRLFRNDTRAAVQIITDLLSKPLVSLRIQDEMLLPPNTPEGTTAGKILMDEATRAGYQSLESNEERKNLLACLGRVPNISFILMLGIAITTPALIALHPSARRRYSPYPRLFLTATLGFLGRKVSGA